MGSCVSQPGSFSSGLHNVDIDNWELLVGYGWERYRAMVQHKRISIRWASVVNSQTWHLTLITQEDSGTDNTGCAL